MGTGALLGGLSGPARRAVPLRPALAPAAARARGGGIPFALLLLFLVVLYANLPLLVPRLEPFAPAQTLAVGALALLFLERAAARRPFRLSWPVGHLLLLLLGVAAVSTATALWPRYALENTLLLAKLLAVHLLIVETVTTWGRHRRMIWVLALAGLFPALGALSFLQRGLVVDGHRAKWIGSFANPNDLAFGLVVLVAPLVAAAISERGWRRFCLVAIVGLFVTVVFFTYSRGSMAALGLVLVLCLLAWGRPWLRVPALVLLGLGALVALPAGWARQEGFTHLDRDRAVGQRIAAARAGLAMFADHPLWGVGPGCSLLGWPRYAPEELQDEGWLHSHNTLVQALSETGLAGTLLFGTAIGATVLQTRRAARRWRRQGRPDRARAVSALEFSIWGFLVCGIAGGYLLSWFPYLFLGMAVATAALADEAPPGSAPPGGRRPAAWAPRRSAGPG
jgi:O-antigen ligase